jgi:predicted permease
LSEIASNIVNVILPIFLVVGAVVLLDRRLALDAIGVSRLVIYVFTPALVFNGLANADFAGGEVEQLVAVAVLTSLGVTALAMAVARVCGFDRKLASAFVISSVLINAGNYGLPLNKFAFGTTGEERALIFFAVTVVISNTLGIYLASRGWPSTSAMCRSVRRWNGPLTWPVKPRIRLCWPY